MTTPTHGKNDTRLDDLLDKARELGVKAGQGKDTLVQFGLLVVNAAYDGVLDLAKDKHGNGVDDAVKAYTEYGKAMASSTVFDHRSASGKVQAAKLRSCIKLGGWTRGGAGEPISTVNKLMAQRDKLRRDPATCKTLDDAYNTLLRYARYQVKQNAVVDDAQLLRAFCLKPVSQTKTLEDFLQDTAKRLDDLRTGRAASNTLSHSSQQLATAVSLIRQEITDLRTGKAEAKVDEDNGE
jgi:hypothetical protein